MDTYSWTREFADSWGLLGLFLFYIGACIWAFLPSQRKAREDASGIPFRNEHAQAVDTGSAPAQSKGKANG